MKKIIALLILLAIIFIVYNRNRLYIRDPLASLTRNGVPESGAQIFINYPSEVLIENDNAPMYVTLVQHTQVGSPTSMRCVHWVACLLDSDVATLSSADRSTHPAVFAPGAVAFESPNGSQAVVKLR